MKFIRPKIVGELKIQKMMAGNFAVVNNIKSNPNKIIIAGNSYEHCEIIIEKIKKAKVGEMLNL